MKSIITVGHHVSSYFCCHVQLEDCYMMLEKLEWSGYLRVKNVWVDMFTRLDTLHECDGRTDTALWHRPRLHSIARQRSTCVFSMLLCSRPVGGALSGHRRPSSVRLSDVEYIGSNSKTKRPRKTKLCTGVPQVTCDSHTDFKVKRSKVQVTGRGHIVAAT